MQCKAVTIIGDLNLGRLTPEHKEGQILFNLEEVYGSECLIKDHTRVTPTSTTLLDVICANQPELFKASGVFNPEVSDHHLIYDLMNERALQHQKRTATFRSTNGLNLDKFNEDLASAPWNGNI